MLMWKNNSVSQHVLKYTVLIPSIPNERAQESLAMRTEPQLIRRIQMLGYYWQL